jgi:GDP/UDP-N,N'-diacetylbacillosamine 2-epimerase (hydrolysing)
MKICVLTGKRGGFGAMRPMLQLIRDDPDIDLRLTACDMHTSPSEFGSSLDEIKEEFEVWPIAWDSGKCERSQYLGHLTTCLWREFSAFKPDLLMLYGDRGESLAAAMVATEMCIPIAHLQGGDTSGTMDNRRRYAISALADLHFVSTEKAANNLWNKVGLTTNVHVVGDSHLDPIFLVDYAHTAEVYAALNLETDKPVFIVLHHPDPTDRIPGSQYLTNIMDAIDDPDRQIVIIHPCSDPGWQGVVAATNWYRGHPNIQIHKNLPSRMFLGLMAIADCIVGNSSCGLIEAPYLDLPCINVGNRQNGRLQSDNVISCEHSVKGIEFAFEMACQLKPPFKKLYGNGAAGIRILNHVKEWHRE